jgi:hypothetical protein
MCFAILFRSFRNVFAAVVLPPPLSWKGREGMGWYGIATKFWEGENYGSSFLRNYNSLPNICHKILAD